MLWRLKVAIQRAAHGNMQISIILLLVVGGLSLGSFVNALVWRLKTKRNFVSERSECTNCHHTLAWYDLIPVLSWLWLRGRCRYCYRKISWQYPLVELSVAATFVGSYLSWPYTAYGQPGWWLLAFWLLAVVLLAALFVYDVHWYELPDRLVVPLIGLGIAYGLTLWFVVRQLTPLAVANELLLSLLPITGLYGILYVVSHRQWVGLGDVKLGIFIGLVLGWQGALLALLIANLLGTVVVLPGLLVGKLTRTSHIPFGPFLILATVIALLWGPVIIEWYLLLLM